eukprot:5917135-Heterocapsa_arctica.AAC.1
MAGPIMQQVRDLGRLPKLVRGSEAAQTAERSLAQRLRRTREHGQLSPEDEAELDEISTKAELDGMAAPFMQQVRSLGRLPKHVR